MSSKTIRDHNYLNRCRSCCRTNSNRYRCGGDLNGRHRFGVIRSTAPGLNARVQHEGKLAKSSAALSALIEWGYQAFGCGPCNHANTTSAHQRHKQPKYK